MGGLACHKTRSMPGYVFIFPDTCEEQWLPCLANLHRGLWAFIRLGWRCCLQAALVLTKCCAGHHRTLPSLPLMKTRWRIVHAAVKPCRTPRTAPVTLFTCLGEMANSQGSFKVPAGLCGWPGWANSLWQREEPKSWKDDRACGSDHSSPDRRPSGHSLSTSSPCFENPYLKARGQRRSPLGLFIVN